MRASDAVPSAAAALTPSSGSWTKSPAPFTRTQACANAEHGSNSCFAGGRESSNSRREAAPCFGRRKMLVHAGSPSGETFEFDSVDWCFAKMAAAAFVALIAVVVWMWLSLGNGGRPLAPQAGRGIQHVHVTGVLRSAPSRPPCAGAGGGRWRPLSAYCS